MNDNLEILDLDKKNQTETISDNTSKKVSILETYGENLSKKEYVTNPAIGREFEIEQAIEVEYLGLVLNMSLNELFILKYMIENKKNSNIL